MTEGADVELWTRRRVSVSVDHMAASISAVGLTHMRPEFRQSITPRRGSVVASPTVGAAARPDYFFHWLRDSAVVVEALAIAIERGFTDRERLRDLGDFVDFSLEIGRLDGPARLAAEGPGETTDAELARYLRSETELETVVGDRVLAEARVNPDATLDILKWARPQVDGPALRALALMRRRPLFEQNRPEAARALLRGDIAFLLDRFDEPSYDVWEYRFGHHYNARLLCLAALERAAAQDAGLGLDAARCDEAARRLRRDLDHHWNVEDGFYLSAIKGTETRSDADLDSAVVLAVAQAGRAGARHSALDPRAQATLARLEQLFAREFPINSGLAPEAAPLPGRFRGDGYYGGGVFLFVAFAAAEIYYRLAGHIRAEGTCRADADNRLFLERCGLDALAAQGPDVFLPQGEERRDIAARLRDRGDSILRRLAELLPDTGEMPEQLDKTTGAPASARNLAWSYAAHIFAVAAREDSLA
ncbi:glycoside hydrolase family 15 protein [Methylosinus sp. Sm6]|uniref:glycoside hydrolase family 15 protein n=1 Tax=Methylosinus sp. Sm6 TaxID=2866948 RepID=UPI001C997D6B|nr:glycoside hydrolase family 15 protein [Methylosinus sp. Sm6]MBY6243828.1 glycoside hydrolase family 15 protein [Methylosinus sp. Sm6]